jgi:FkbM family methyltransferase
VIVVDVGCKTHEKEESIDTLIHRYAPSVLFGFDPHPQLANDVRNVRGDALAAAAPLSASWGTTVVTRRLAAWTRNGYILFEEAGASSRVGSESVSTEVVECFDLAAFILTLPRVDVLKIDAEGAEYRLVPHLLRHGIDDHVELLLVEWHNGPIACSGGWKVEPWEPRPEADYAAE